MARGLPMSDAEKTSTPTGQNLANYVQHMERSQPRAFTLPWTHVTESPGVSRIATKKSDDGRILLQFNDRGYKDPFSMQDMSDGTLKMFAYLLLLEIPDPLLIGIEEPENGLHHQLLEPLAKQMKDGSQKTNGPTDHRHHAFAMFVDSRRRPATCGSGEGRVGAELGRRASDIPGVKEMAAEGIPLGSLWYSNHFGRGNP